jgi:hypothetical protein
MPLMCKRMTHRNRVTGTGKRVTTGGGFEPFSGVSGVSRCYAALTVAGLRCHSVTVSVLVIVYSIAFAWLPLSGFTSDFSLNLTDIFHDCYNI